jgi:hypothetical protein
VSNVTRRDLPRQGSSAKEPILIIPSPGRDDERKLAPDLEQLAYWMDSVFEFPGLGFRFGFDAIVGLIPAVGDTITSFISLYILSAARRYGVPRTTMTRMAANIAIDYVIGSIPILGDAFDVAWKANKMNVALLRRHILATPAEQQRARSSDRLFVAGLIFVLILLLIGSITLGYFVLSALGRGLMRLFS